MKSTADVVAAAPAVRMTGICKRFGAVQANDDVTLEVAAGTVHGIVGENGAGKSTLMSVLYGLHAADRGTIEVFGRALKIRNPHEAIALGIGMVHQHFMLVDSLSALENLMLGAEPHALLRRAEAAMRPRLYNLMQSTGLKLALDTKVAELPVGDRQRLEILKALVRGAKILILDEPTAVLTPQETEQLFQVLARLAAQGTTILLITHKLKEVMRLCERVTVMRAGRVVHETAVRDTSVAALATAMIGRQPRLDRHDAPRAPGEIRLEAAGLQLRDALGVSRLRGLSLQLRAGEIVGIAGVSGNGQSELLELLSGMRAPAAGTLRLGAARFHAAHWLDPHRARRLSLAHVPEDRQARALVLGFAAWESAVLGYEAEARASSRRGWMHNVALRQAAARLMQRFDVRPRDIDLGCADFSGGNQQKLVLAREIDRAPRVLLVGQPTRGVDIGAIEFIHARLRALRDAGCAVLLVSSELDEILALADRVLVMHAGRIVGERPVGACTEAELGLMMAGGA